MSLSPDLLYSWLPAHIRIRDQAEGEPLRALMAVVQQVCDDLHDDMSGLYRNWFIETADEWVVPYTGDLVGIARLRDMSPHAYTLRAYVANAIALRRRKGTPGSLEQLAQDVTGWYASVLEMFQTVSTTQHIKHPRLASMRTPALRSADEMDRLYGPFEHACHTLDVRNIDSALPAAPPLPATVQPGPPATIAVLTQRDRGRYNLQAMTLFLWRLRAWPVTLAPPVVHAGAGGGAPDWYHFNQLGSDMQLFNFPQTKLEPASLAQEHQLPGELRRAALYLELEARRQAEVDGTEIVPAWFGAQPPFRIYKNGVEISPSQILVTDLDGCDQSGWQPPPSTHRYYDTSGGFQDKPITTVVDPVLGRFLFTTGNAPQPGDVILVSYYYGFSSDLGGGTYDRHADLDDRTDFSFYQVDHGTGGSKALQQRLADWIAQGPNTPGAVIEILDNQIYELDANLVLSVPQGKHLEIRATNRKRPVILLDGILEVRLPPHAGLTLNGLWVKAAAGAQIVVKADVTGPTDVSLIHTTLVPQASSALLQIVAPTGAASAPLSASCTLRRSVTGGLDLSALGSDCVLDIQDSIVDRTTGKALDHGGVLRATASTVLGETRAAVLEVASNMLFTGTVMSERRQPGIVRYSYAPFGSELPPRFQCQPPELAGGTPDTAFEAVLYRLQPRFTSVVYGQPGYCQLATSMTEEIVRGASDEGEMGVWNHLEQSQRTLNLKDALNEYLRLGLEAGLIFVT